MDRRTFNRWLVTAGAGAATLGPAGWRIAGAAALRGAAAPYGPLGDPDEHGIRLPAGFTSHPLAAGLGRVEPSGYRWPPYPDGGATFADPSGSGGWIYVANSETIPPFAGASALRFAADGTIVDAYRILEGTRANCAGGATPWGTWLSCEEHPDGRVWECDPTGAAEAVPHMALGVFQHEAAAVVPSGDGVYLTEDRPDGCLYRFTPVQSGDLAAGTLEVAVVTDGTVRWAPVPDPSASEGTATRYQVGEAAPFDGGEGIWTDGTTVWFTTKGDNRVWALDLASSTLVVLYDGEGELDGVDNIVGAANGDLYVAEDGGDMQLVLLTPGGIVTPFLQIVGQDGSEITGPAFSPDGTRLYFSSQRGRLTGITYEVTGPFRRPPATTTSAPTTTPPQAAGATKGTSGDNSNNDGDDGDERWWLAGGAAAAVTGAAGAVLAARRRGLGT